jgi:uncharacterized protein GlcG (DUF336 family)
MAKTIHQLTYEEARVAVDAALEKAREIGASLSIAVVDGGRELIAFARMEDALLASAEIAQNKAYTARCLNMATADLGPLTQPGGPYFGLEHTHRRPMVSFGGGLPLQIDGEYVGAIGVSGGSGEQDVEVASAGVSALGDSHPNSPETATLKAGTASPSSSVSSSP